MNEEKDIIVVEAEIVEDIPDTSFCVPILNPEDIPEGSIPAPDPKRLRQGYFQKGGRGGPGRKRFYQKPEEMEAVCLEYFRTCQVSTIRPGMTEIEYVWKVPPTIPGLARALGMTSRALLKYQDRDEFSDVVEWAKDVIREYYEISVNQQGNPVGKIFMMKNLGYTDVHTVTYAPPSRLQAAQTPDEIAKLVDEDIV